MLNERAQVILGRARECQDSMLDVLRGLCDCESPTEEPDRQESVFAILGEALEASGYRCRRLQGRHSGGQLLAYPRGRVRSQPSQLLMGHVDTVWPVGTLQTMPLTMEEGVLRGPGVYDMKSGLVILLFALRILHDLEIPLSVTPIAFFNSDEEKGSHDSSRHIVRLARCVDRAFILEPSLGPEGRLKTARKGVGRYSIEVKGRAAHAGLDPERGASAILEMSHQVQRLFALNDVSRGITVNVGTVEGGMGVNVIAPTSRAEIDVRVPSREAAEELANAITALKPVTPGVTVHVTCGACRVPMEANDRNQELWTLAVEMAGYLGLPILEGMSGGASDGNITSCHTATLDGLGAVGAGAHAHHEQIQVDSLAERAALLAMLVQAPSIPGSAGKRERRAEEDARVAGGHPGGEDSSCNT